MKNNVNVELEVENQELDNKIYVKDENGKTLEGEIVFEFELDGDEFVAYVIDETLYVMKYDEEGNLFPVEEDEWPLVEKVVNSYLEGDDEEGEE